MKQLLTSLILLLAFTAQGQVTYQGTPNTTVITRGGAFSDSLTAIAVRDTVTFFPANALRMKGRVTMRPQDGNLYINNGEKWISAGSGSGGGGGGGYPSFAAPSAFSVTGSGTSAITLSGSGASNQLISGSGALILQSNLPVSDATQTALDAKQGVLSLTTTGTSGAATLSGNNLNIPQYTGGSGDASNQLRVFNVVTDFGAIENGDTSASTRATNRNAFLNAIAAATAAGGGTIVVPSGNCQTDPVHVPYRPFAYPTQAFVPITIRGEVTPSMLYGTIGAPPLATGGSIIQCQSQDSTQAIFYFDYPSISAFSGYTFTFENLDLRTYQNSRISGIDARGSEQLIMRNCTVNNGVYSVLAHLPTVNTSYGVRTPARDNGALSILDNVAVSGFYNGVEFNEHASSTYMNLTCNRYALILNRAAHNRHIDRLCTQRNQNTICLFDNGDAWFTIDSWDNEHANPANQVDSSNAWQVTKFDINDSLNHGHADLTYSMVLGAYGTNYNEFKKAGGVNILTRYEGLERGAYNPSNYRIANPVSYDSVNAGIRYYTGMSLYPYGYNGSGIGLGQNASGDVDQWFNTGAYNGGSNYFSSRGVKTLEASKLGILTVYPNATNPVSIGGYSGAPYGMLTFNQAYGISTGLGLFGGANQLYMTAPLAVNTYVGGVQMVTTTTTGTGFGTTNPTDMLTVAGNISTTGQFYQTMDNGFITSNRISTSAYSGFRTASAYGNNFIIGAVGTADNDLHIYSYGLGSDAFTVSKATGSIKNNAPIILKGYTVAGLPTGVIGATAYVTDALTPTYGATIVGGGAVVKKVFYNGSNWIAD